MVFSDSFSSDKLVISEGSDGFLLSKTAILMENACRSEREELNSTEKIPLWNEERLKTGLLSSGDSPCGKRTEKLGE